MYWLSCPTTKPLAALIPCIRVRKFACWWTGLRWALQTECWGASEYWDLWKSLTHPILPHLVYGGHNTSGLSFAIHWWRWGKIEEWQSKLAFKILPPVFRPLNHGMAVFHPPCASTALITTEAQPIVFGQLTMLIRHLSLFKSGTHYTDPYKSILVDSCI